MELAIAALAFNPLPFITTGAADAVTLATIKLDMVFVKVLSCGFDTSAGTMVPNVAPLTLYPSLIGSRLAGTTPHSISCSGGASCNGSGGVAGDRGEAGEDLG